MNGYDIKAVAFFNEDLDCIDPVYTVNGVDRGYFSESIAITIMIDDIPVACGGVHEVFKGSGVAWAWIDKNIPKACVRRVAMLLRKHFHEKVERHGFHRIQADVEVGLEKAERFVRFLGFESEGIMKAFGPDKQDYERYAYVRC